MDLKKIMALTEEYVELAVQRATANGVFHTNRLKGVIKNSIAEMNLAELKEYYDGLMSILRRKTISLGNAIELCSSISAEKYADEGEIVLKLVDQVQSILFATKNNVDAMKKAQTLEEMYDIQSDFVTYQKRRPAGNNGEYQVADRALRTMAQMIDEKKNNLTKDEQTDFVIGMKSRKEDMVEASADYLSKLAPVININDIFADENPEVMATYKRMAESQRNYTWDKYDKYNHQITGLISIANNAEFMFGSEGM